MKSFIQMLTFFPLVFCAMPATAVDLPDTSLYQLPVSLAGPGHEAGADFAVFRGQPVIVSMFYGSCPHVCPMLISTIQMLEKQLPAEQRANLRVLMLSLDPERDSIAKLAELAAQHNVDSERWLLARASASDVRKLAAILDVKYKQLPDGNFNHTTVIKLLDRQGVPLAATSRLGVVDAEFLKILQQQTAERP